jgi:hypothetical protein
VQQNEYTSEKYPMSTTGVADSNPTFDTLRLAVQDGLKALAGGGQSPNSLATDVSSYRVTTVTSANDSVTLPKAQAGLVKIVANAAASNSMNVFPSKGDSINALGANNAFAMAAGKVAILICLADGQWHSVLTA